MGEKHVTLEQMLAAKERRVLRQRALLEQYGQSLVCLTMNIAGPVKNNRLIRRGFLEGERRLLGQLASGGFRCLHQERHMEVTGNEADGGAGGSLQNWPSAGSGCAGFQG